MVNTTVCCFPSASFKMLFIKPQSILQILPEKAACCLKSKHKWCPAMGLAEAEAREAKSQTGTWTLKTATGGFGWLRCPSISVIGGRRRLLIQRWGNVDQDPFVYALKSTHLLNDGLRWASWGSTRSQDRSLTSTSPWPTQSARQWLGSASLTRMLW